MWNVISFSFSLKFRVKVNYLNLRKGCQKVKYKVELFELRKKEKKIDNKQVEN